MVKKAFILRYYRYRDKLLPPGTGRRLLLMIFAESVRRGTGRGLFKRSGDFVSLILRFIAFRKSAERLLNGIVSDRLRGLSAPHPGDDDEARLHALKFTKISQPRVSIVIPVMNKWSLTLKCLRSIESQQGDVPLEVVVIDNGSSDETPGALSEIENIVVKRSETNLGFVEACNLGVETSQGEYVLFLNNDTVLLPGAIRSLIDAMERDGSIGLVGAKLLYPDGRLQEAGGIVWNDPVNLAWNFGRYDSPGKWEYNYVKETDYCSGACLLARKDLLERLGSFDCRFAPAYCEDTDLAFSARQAGFKVIYQPAAEVLHFEGATAGTDTGKGFKKYQRINTETFVRKWKETLERDHFANGEHVFLARDRSRFKKRMLYVDHQVPTFDKDAGSLITFEYLKIFRSLGIKIVFWPADLDKREPYTSVLQQMGMEVVYGYSNFARYISETGSYLDYVFLSRPLTAKRFIRAVRRHSRVKLFYVAHDLHFLREGRRAEVEGNGKLASYARKLKETELDIIENSDLALVFSPTERDILKQERPRACTDIMPWIQAVHGTDRSFRDRKDIMFLGSFVHMPNQDGLKWFVGSVLPGVRAGTEKVNLVVAGSSPTEEIRSLGGADIFIRGYVPDTTVLFQEARVFVAPLRYGAGIKGKIVEAMSHGLPVVTTSIGAEGLGLRDGEDAMIADSPQEFSAKVVRLYTSEALWSKISENSLKYVTNNSAPEQARSRFAKILEIEGEGRA